MKKYFVTYEQALALKELGFDEPCFGFYSVLYDLMITQTNGKKSLFELECLAPLKQQVFRWFRDKHGLHIGICHAVNGKFDCWTNNGNLLDEGKYCDFKTYEEAESACIDKLITIIKNNLDK